MGNNFVKRSIKGKQDMAKPVSKENAAPNNKSSTPKGAKPSTPKRKSSMKKKRMILLHKIAERVVCECGGRTGSSDKGG